MTTGSSANGEAAFPVPVFDDGDLGLLRMVGNNPVHDSRQMAGQFGRSRANFTNCRSRLRTRGFLSHSTGQGWALTQAGKLLLELRDPGPDHWHYIRYTLPDGIERTGVILEVQGLGSLLRISVRWMDHNAEPCEPIEETIYVELANFNLWARHEGAIDARITSRSLSSATPGTHIIIGRRLSEMTEP